jgi:hypothetical protein
VRGHDPVDAAPAPAAYNWGAYACFASVSLPYIQLALSKLASGGLFWFEGAGQRNLWVKDNLNLMRHEIDLALRFHDAPTIYFTLAALGALAVEAAYPLVLVWPRSRWVLPAVVALLHVGILVGSDVLFLDAILIPAIFYLPSRFRRSTGELPA